MRNIAVHVKLTRRSKTLKNDVKHEMRVEWNLNGSRKEPKIRWRKEKMHIHNKQGTYKRNETSKVSKQYMFCL